MTDSPASAAPVEAEGGTNREWPRVLALVLFLVSTSALSPFALVAGPFILLLMGMPVRRRTALLAGALVAAVLLLRDPGTDGVWYLERAWAVLAGGFFVALCRFLPGQRLTHRALGAVAGAGAVAGLLFLVRPGAWSVVDWAVRDRVTSGVAQALALLRAVQGSEAVPPELEASIYRTVEIQADLFPALVGLTTLAALGVAWWGYSRLALGRRGALAPVREFRFEDQLVWVFIGGLLLLAVTGGEGWTRVGSNTLVFMGALYALRGAAVFLFLNGGLTLLGGILLAIGILFMAPILGSVAVLIGLGDTWLEFRAKARAMLG